MSALASASALAVFLRCLPVFFCFPESIGVAEPAVLPAYLRIAVNSLPGWPENPGFLLNPCVDFDAALPGGSPSQGLDLW